jgi:antitoxin CptB
MNASPPETVVGPPPAGPAPSGKLRWRCRRGMKELDVLLERYLDERFCAASDAERAAFQQLLDTPDPILHAYCLGSERPPPRYAALIERITVNRSDRPNAPAER